MMDRVLQVERIHQPILITLGASGLVGLFVLAASIHAPLGYDEVPYLRPVSLLHQYGLSLQYIRDYPEPAGLLHNVLHWTLEPITGLRPPFVRLVNPVVLSLAILFTFLTLRLVGSTQALSSSLTMIGIPFTWVLAGMALTEMPSIMLTALSIFLVVKANKNQVGRPSFAFWVALAGGISLGIASLNRAMVLVILGALPCLLIADWRRSLITVLAFASGTIAVVVPIMIVWGGVVPPHSVVQFTMTNFSIYHLILSFSYAAVVMMILAPTWFNLNIRVVLCILVTIFTLNIATGLVEIAVAQSVVGELPPSLATIVPRIAGSTMLALAALFIVCSGKNLIARRGDPIWLFFLFAMLLLIASAGKIVHEFSSRYTGMASTTMILAADPLATSSVWRVLGMLCGMLIGLSSLLSYYSEFAR
jgi:4-amino-4-deoxy-L-arabinose transferase-like glycosyltransferase